VTSPPSASRAATSRLAEQLRGLGSALTVFPCAEVMVWPDLEKAWGEGKLLSVGDGGKYLLIELPHGLFVDLTGLVRRLTEAGVRADPRSPGAAAGIHRRCRPNRGAGRGGLSGAGVVRKRHGAARMDERRHAEGVVPARGWRTCSARTDHSPRRRRPLMAAAYERIVKWAGQSVADRVCGTNGVAVLHGAKLRIAPPLPKRRWWIAALLVTSERMKDEG